MTARGRGSDGHFPPALCLTTWQARPSRLPALRREVLHRLDLIGSERRSRGRAIVTDPNPGVHAVTMAERTAGSTADEIRALDRAHVLHTWSTQSQIDPFVVAGAEGRHFWGQHGRRILDFASLVVNANLGHQHPRVVEAIATRRAPARDRAGDDRRDARAPRRFARRDRAGRPHHVAVHHRRGRGDRDAIKLARWYTGRHKIVAGYRSYHGRRQER